MDITDVPGGLPHALVQDAMRSMLAYRSAVQVQKDTFNHMLDTTLHEIVNERYQHSTVNGLGDAMMTVTFRNTNIALATVREQYGAERTVTPTECILRKLPYVFRVMCTISVELYVNRDSVSPTGSTWIKYDPITGELRSLATDPLHNAGLLDGETVGSMTTEDGTMGEMLAPTLAGVSLESTDNPDDTHELVTAAKDRAQRVQWALQEVYEAGQQCIMELPVQIGSHACITGHMPLLNPNGMWYAPGEFIPNGTYRMVVQQRRVQVNRALVTPLRGTTRGAMGQIRSFMEHRYRSTSTMNVKLCPDLTSPEPLRAWVELPYVNCKVPLMAVFRLLGVRTVERAARMIATGGDDAGYEPWDEDCHYNTPERQEFKRWVTDLLRPIPKYKKRRKLDAAAAHIPPREDTSAEAVAAWARPPSTYTPAFPDFETMTQKEVGEWISARATTGAQYNKDAKWMSTLSTETLPQLGLGTAPRTLAARAMLLAHTAWRAAVVCRRSTHDAEDGRPALLRATAASMWDAPPTPCPIATGGASPEDRDAVGNNHYDTTGDLTQQLIRQNMIKQIKAVMVTLRHCSMQTAQIADNLRKPTTTHNARYAFNTGNWGERKGNATPSQQETTQQRQQGNLMSQRSHLMGCRTPLREKSKNSEARELHKSYFGFICSAAHSEGKQCGLRVQPAVGAHITCGQQSREMLPVIARALARDIPGFVPVPFPAVLSGRVAAAPPPRVTSSFNVTQQHMVRSARHMRKQVFRGEQERFRLATLSGVAGTTAAAAPGVVIDAAESTAIVASMKWPGSAAAEAAMALHSHDWDSTERDLTAHATAIRRLPPTMARIFVNGILLGHVPQVGPAARHLREMRRASLLPRDVEIAVMDGGSTIWVGSQAGEMRRPLWILTPEARDTALRVWRKWRRARGPPEGLWPRLLAERAIEYVGPNEVVNLVIAQLPQRLDWARGAADGFSHAELHPSAALSMSVGCLPFPNHNQGPRVAYYYALANAKSSEPPAVLANETSLTFMPHAHERIPKTIVERGIFPGQYGAGNMALVAVMAAGSNVEDSMIMQAEAAAAGMLSIVEVHTYMDEAARGAAARRSADGKVFGKPTQLTYATHATNYNTLQADGLPRLGTRVRPGSAVLGIQRRRRISDYGAAAGAIDAGASPDTIAEHDGSTFTSARDVPCVVSDVRISPSLRVGYTLAVVQTMALRPPECGDKVAVTPSQKGTVPVLMPASHMPVSPQLGRPHLIMNPHAIPSRMTGGKDIEGLVALAALIAGESDPDGTPWGTLHSESWARRVLSRAGVAACGHHTFYDSITGKPLPMTVYMVPQMVFKERQLAGNKINMRATGPVNQLTGQPTEGRVNGGGQRLGNMENDAIASSGAAGVLLERFRDASDRRVAWLCTDCNCIGIPPAAADVHGAVVDQHGRITSNMVAWHAHMSSDTHARCPLCGRGETMVRVDSRQALLLLVRELEAVGIRVKFHVLRSDAVDTLSPPSPSVMRPALQRTPDSGAPRTVPYNASIETRLRLQRQQVPRAGRGGQQRPRFSGSGRRRRSASSSVRGRRGETHIPLLPTVPEEEGVTMGLSTGAEPVVETWQAWNSGSEMERTAASGAGGGMGIQYALQGWGEGQAAGDEDDDAASVVSAAESLASCSSDQTATSYSDLWGEEEGDGEEEEDMSLYDVIAARQQRRQAPSSLGTRDEEEDDEDSVASWDDDVLGEDDDGVTAASSGVYDEDDLFAEGGGGDAAEQVWAWGLE